MIQVPNRKCIRRLSRKSLQASSARNRIAIMAIALTTLLFTVLFTVSMTLIKSYEQANFRQVGGSFHGGFKDLTEEQVKELSSDSEIVRWGSRLMLGMPTEPPFNKAHVEVSYMDKNYAEFGFCTPTVGALPREGTKEIACDTRILALLGVTPEIGATVKMPYILGETTPKPIPKEDTFILSGWWEYDPAGMASQAVVARSYAEEILSSYERLSANDVTGTWNLSVFFKNSRHIVENMNGVLERHGYQCEKVGEDNYINIGINWAYSSTQLAQNADPMTMISIIVLLLLIAFTGYLIIYNIFQISVSNDIRFYGLLKTIGTTGKQIKTIIRRQALWLSIVGIPIGLVIGWFMGIRVAPVIISQLNGVSYTASTSPVIFIGAMLFSLLTVLISCHRPGKMAARISPVEAVRYTEGADIKKKKRLKRGQNGAKISHMAFANLGRSRKKTILTVASLSLAVVLMQVTYTFANGFDMDKYLRNWVVTDFILANADYFQTSGGFRSEDQALPEEAITAVNNAGTVTESGRIYGQTSGVQEFVTEEWFRDSRKYFAGDEMLDMMLKYKERTPDGLITDDARLYGMDKLPLDRLTVQAGDLAPLYDPNQNAIAAVYMTDDYNQMDEKSQWANPGDEITLRYVDEWESYDTRTGEVLSPEQADEMTIDPELYNYIGRRAKTFRDVTYTVAACVTMRHSMSYRYYGQDQFILNSEVFQRDTGTSDIMTYLYNTTPESNAQMEAFLENYTKQIDPLLDYESKQKYAEEFDDFRNMFLLLGGLLSLIIGLVGVLNFFNAILTGILTRRREFAVLQAVGMTGKQLEHMLMEEGLCYIALSTMTSLILSLIAAPIIGNVIGAMFWFFSYRFSLLPIVCIAPIFIVLGAVLPLVTYRFMSRQSIVERIRTQD